MSLWRIFCWPLAIAALTLLGLISGLVSDSWGDAVAAVGLWVPGAVAAWFGLGWRSRRRARATAHHPSHDHVQAGTPAKPE